jgi:glucosylceramidase
MTRPNRLLAAVACVALALGLGAVVAPAAAPAAPPTDAPRAHVWVTTPDQSETMADRGTVAFHQGGSSLLTVTVDPSLRYQRMEGFGASITDSSASVLSSLDPATRAATLRDLFVGDGLSVLRQPLGSSDFVDGPHYTFDDMPAGETDFGLTHFSIDHDRAQILPLLREARALNPHLEVIGTPWSPPAWMKTNDSLIGGRLIDDPRVYDAYARYLTKVVQAYSDAGVPIHALTVQNEPQNRTPNGYPGTDMPVRQEAAVIERLGPDLAAAGLDTMILGYDHNWSEHPNDIANTPPGEDPETEYPTSLLQSGAGRWLAGTAYHCYAGDQTRMTALHHAFPTKGVWFTECSGSHGPSDPPAQVFRDTLTWHARNLTLGVPRNWAKTVVNWNLALRPDGGPHNGGCDTCTGVVTVHDAHTVTRNAEYYTLGHLARFVQPGAWRVASSSFGTTGWNGMVMDVAFENPDGSTVLVVHNEHDDPRSFAVAEGDHSFDYTLPGGALATFVWPSGQSLDDSGPLVDPTTVSVSSNVHHEQAAAASDDDAATTWSTGDPQRSGDEVTVDLGAPTRIRDVVLDAGPSSYGFFSDGSASDAAPASYRLEVSGDGHAWTTVRTAGGTGQLTTLKVPHNPIRFVRATLTRDAAQPWTIAEVRVHR